MAAATINGTLEAVDLAVESGAKLNGEVKPHTQELHLVEGTAQPQAQSKA